MIDIKFENIFTINNLSKCYNYSINTHWRNRKKEYLVKPNLIGIYCLYDKNKKIVYVGKSSNNIRLRLIRHLLSEIHKGDFDFKECIEKREIVKYFSFKEFDKKDIHFIETFLINKYQPKLNKQYK